jgi:peptidoglycan/LPS O-acetylase OafA/YrhL
VTTAPAGPLQAGRRTPWSRAAAAASLALSGLELDVLVRDAEPQAYLVVILTLGAVLGGLAGLGVALRNCVVSRALAATVAVGVLAAVALLLTVGTPGSTGAAPLDATAAVAAALGLAVPALVAADAAGRSARGSVRRSVRRARW